MIKSITLRSNFCPAIAWIGVLLLSVCCHTMNGQETKSEKSDGQKKDERFMVVLTIGEAEANALRRDGQLRATLPAKFKNRVDSVLLKHPTTFLSKKLLIKDDVDKLGRTLLVNVNESIVDRLEYQPVQMKIYQSGFDSITLKYQRPRNRNRQQAMRQGTRPQKDDSPRVFVRLSPENGTSGWVRKMEFIPVETQFGAAKIPLRRIAGIRFNADADDDVVVISVTGDYVTGKIDFDQIVLATRWGDEKIAVSELESITHHREARFLEGDPKVGKRWVLTQPAQPTRSSLPPTNFPAYPSNRGLPNSSF